MAARHTNPDTERQGSPNSLSKPIQGNRTISPELAAVKAVYMEKAQKLSKANQAKLAFCERNTMDVIRGLKGGAYEHALQNYYEHTATLMKGSKLDMPALAQILHHEAKPSAEKTRTSSPTHDNDPEIER